MAINRTPGPRVAIIRNYVNSGQWGADMLNRIGELVHKSAPDADIQHFQPIDDEEVPKLSKFDLVILTGGTWDLTKPVQDPWVLKLVAWLQKTSTSSRTKVLGICWGHQAVSYAMGGKIMYREEGTMIDVEDIPLTKRGQDFFGGRETLALHKFHKRIVAEPPTGFQPLGEREEIFLSDDGHFLTFQGHPEMTAGISHQLLDRGDTSYFPDPSPEGVIKKHQKLDRSHDGEMVFARAMDWAFGAELK